jgi:hypothetical protein
VLHVAGADVVLVAIDQPLKHFVQHDLVLMLHVLYPPKNVKH